MIKLYTSMALSSILRAKWRSLLTMLGVIIGITSVVMIFALGEGLKRQVSGELKDLGADMVMVRSGNIIERDDSGKVAKVNLSDVFTQSSLTESDVDSLKRVPGVAVVAPSAYISAPISDQEGTPLGGDSTVIATTPQIRDILNKDVETGQFFTTPEIDKNLAVLGADIAKTYFGEDPPVGRIIKIKNTEFIIRGVMESSPPSPLDTINTNYNNAIYIPLGAGKKLNGGVIGIREIGLKLNSTDDVAGTIRTIDSALSEPRQGVKDYSILESRDFIQVLDSVFGVLTIFVAAVAAISLFVGGIGIMNIMLVSVSERTREIGIRKSIGATNQQILGQFLIEAIILTLLGGLIGVGISLAASGLLRIYSELQPFVEWRIVAGALGVTLMVGIIFGIVPALKAARKDPIESLR